ncbi:MAG: nitrite/formate transporter [Candidatus Brocadia sp.]|jgi:formate/nitrite transporter|uniref:Nitrite/formate transporter n=1 Tax=Candidatus Brocadia fulgida TaxID=380242 RepID=A0A0M2V1T5_9BACT|nr:MAG: nitrite/formate transporter [Candidatus Brocadia fulgida]MCC6326349.1 formate/nitrite transporter family protein [Candidatus Brocadia sp.]MCE7911734.1 formate/nitrite transporter family protein [Candidatus Brocadia sp. AMX3]OQZ00113.1 MAG: nitrite/formate transporter [Candidatus Brocadia sp. UTAMX2]MBV6519074.1 putative formate transporter 1 [Candidatus Brocadia fulgida]
MADQNTPKTVKIVDIDAYSPPQIAERIDTIATVKASIDTTKTFLLGILAGAYIAFGAQFATLVTCDSTLHYGLTALVAGIVFSLGLILVVIASAELFTGNTLIIMGYVSRRINTRDMLNNWVISYAGNFVGSISMVFWMYHSHQFEFFHHMVGAKALLIANMKVNYTFKTALARGVLCNSMVCLAVWLCFSGRSVADKVISIIFPIGGFVASGFEHSIANMYFIPIGIVLRKNPDVVAAAEKMTGKALDLSQLTWKGFVFNNLIAVTLGNIVGGVILVGIMFWFVYLRPNISLSFSVKQDFFREKK